MGQGWENFAVGRDRERALGVWEKASKWGEKQARGCWRLAPPTSPFYHEAALVDALGSEPAEQSRAEQLWLGQSPAGPFVVIGFSAGAFPLSFPARCSPFPPWASGVVSVSQFTS